MASMTSLSVEPTFPRGSEGGLTEDAPNNAVRIFTGVDVVAPTQSVWDLLTEQVQSAKFHELL